MDKILLKIKLYLKCEIKVLKKAFEVPKLEGDTYYYSDGSIAKDSRKRRYKLIKLENDISHI